MIAHGLASGWSNQHRRASDDSLLKALYLSGVPFCQLTGRSTSGLVHSHKICGRIFKMLPQDMSYVDCTWFFFVKLICSASMLSFMYSNNNL